MSTSLARLRAGGYRVALRAGGTGLRIEPRPDESLLAEMRQHGTSVAAELRAEAEGRLYAAAVACNVEALTNIEGGR